MSTPVKPDDNVLRALFERVHSVAIVGAKDIAGQPVDRVGRYLIREGFEVFPIHLIYEKIILYLPSIISNLSCNILAASRLSITCQNLLSGKLVS